MPVRALNAELGYRCRRGPYSLERDKGSRLMVSRRLMDVNRLVELATQPVYQVKDGRKYKAQQDARGQGKIERAILAAINNIPRQLPQRQVNPANRYEQ